jgi:23S rRNA pseudouridine1911/1915/1917 synthase
MSEGLSAQPVVVTVESRAHGWRVDHYLARLYPNYSRALFQRAIEQGGVLLNGLAVKASRRLRVNDVLSVRLPQAPDETLPPEDIPLDVVFEDESLVVINKAAGMITHPGKAHYRGTLAGALQFHFDLLSDVAGKLRPGIVHRLDRDTSGLIVVAKDNQVHHALSSQFERREVSKEYQAIVWGVINRDADRIETFMRVNPGRREAMMVCDEGGNARLAVTSYEVLERFHDFTYVRLLPRTGRTHQLRVHLRHLGHAIVADRLYGGRAALTRSYLAGETLPKSLRRSAKDAPLDPADVLISRQALHARRLTFRHPVSGEQLEFEAPLPLDMENTLLALRNPAPPNML